ncbi:MAG: ABC transporter substrate-binding protein [Methanotrichaceae archaeon]|nr:ABC transporter substrate-binding protein [Methanotrichaceae archaeon]
MKIKSVSALLILPLVALLFCAPSGAADYPLTITDTAGREVTFPMPVERVIVLSSDAAEAVVMLGGADKVVGVSDTVQKKGYYFPLLKEKQSIGKWNAPDYEMIGEIARGGEESIAPDIVVIGYSYPDKPYGIFGVEKGLAPFEDIRAVALEFTKPENMTREIETLGTILGKEEEAQDYINWYREKRDSVEQAVNGLNKPKVYAEWSSTSDLSTLGEGSGFDQVLSVANGYNIAKKLDDAYPKVGWEWVVSQNPEVILKRQTQSSDQTQVGWEAGPSKDTVKLQSVRNELLARSGASGLSAVKADRVFVMDWDVLNGLDQVVGITYLAKLLHPEADLDPVSVHREYLQRLGLEYPEGRILVYPQLEMQ